MPRRSPYYDHRWRKLRRAYLAANPLCVGDCQAKGRTTAAIEVDHVIPHKGDWELFLDWDNLQGLCKPCHSRKTNRDEHPAAFESWFDPTPGAQ